MHRKLSRIDPSTRGSLAELLVRFTTSLAHRPASQLIVEQTRQRRRLLFFGLRLSGGVAFDFSFALELCGSVLSFFAESSLSLGVAHS